MILHDYQISMLEKARAMMRDGKRSILMTLATGGGKTVVAASMIQRAVLRGKRILFFAHRRELVEQCARKLNDFGVKEYGIVMSGHWRFRPYCNVQVASKDSLAPAIRAGKIRPNFDFVFIDEAHRSSAQTYRAINQAIRQHNPDSVFVGLTATPYRQDGKGLSDVFDCMVNGPQTPDLIERGYLTPCRVFASSKMDLSGVKTRQGEYDMEEIARRAEAFDLHGDSVRQWKKHASGRPTILFAINRKFAKDAAERFSRSGIPASYVDGDTDIKVRESAIRDLESGAIKVLCNVDVFTEGTDIPCVSCIIAERPTKSRRMWRQAIGRGGRLFPGKKDFILLDCAQWTAEHGFFEDREVYSLEGIGKKPKDAKKRGYECSMCDFVCAEKFAVCPECGAVQSPRGTSERHRELTVDSDAEFVEITRAQLRNTSRWTALAREAIAKGYKPGWAHRMFKFRYGRYPTLAEMGDYPVEIRRGPDGKPHTFWKATQRA